MKILINFLKHVIETNDTSLNCEINKNHVSISSMKYILAQNEENLFALKQYEMKNIFLI